MIKTAQSEDYSQLVLLFEDIRNTNEAAFGFDSWTSQTFEKSLNNSSVLIEIQDEQIVGFLMRRAIPDGIEIDLLGTHPKFRKRGVMGNLISESQRQVERGQKIWLEVHESNTAARNLYAKHGFKEVGKRLKYYKDGGACISLEYIS